MVINVSLVYSPAKNEAIITLNVVLELGATVQDALNALNIAQLYPETVNCDIGIYSKKVNLSHVLTDKDRIEIYRPLILDPKQARKNRAKLKL